MEQELKYAQQVLRKDLPEKIVDLNKTVEGEGVGSGLARYINLVALQKAKKA